MVDPRTELSVVTDHGVGPYHSCGYCGGKDGSLSHGMPVRKLTVYAYQDLIDQGWRRSGCYLYKPDLARSCCKAYTIRLDAQQFSPDKGQRRLIRKWRSYLGGETPSGSGAAGESIPIGLREDRISASDLPMAPGDQGAGIAKELDGAAPGTSEPSDQAGHALQPQRGSREHWHTSPRDVRVGRGPKGAVTVAEAADLAAAAKERVLQQLMNAALAAAVAAGDLPVAVAAGGVHAGAAVAAAAAPPPPSPAVRRCSEKQRQALPPDVCYTSAGAFPLAVFVAKCSAAAGGTAVNATPAAAASGIGGASPATAAGASPASSTGDTCAGAAAAAAAAGGSLGQRKSRPKMTPAAVGAMSAQGVAEVLVRHFNAVASAAWGSGPAICVATGGEAGMVGAGAAPAAEWRQHVPVQPEALAAGGHINIRIAASPQPQRQTYSAAADAASAAPQVGDGKADARGGGGSGNGNGSAARVAAAAAAPNGPGSSTGSVGADTKARTRTSGAAAAAAAVPAGGGGCDPDLLAMPSGRLEIRMVPSAFIPEEFELYKRYQVAQHGDKPGQLTRESYTRFLVDSPLPHVGRGQDPSAPDCGYGSFHQQYLLDGKLIAVGVVDVLPRCLSSVYFFWDTELASLALGRFSALQEILWVLQNCGRSPQLHYYYMGFYIHTCPKMRYKAEYHPSDLLCPLRKVWVRITPQLLAELDERPYLELSDVQGAMCQPNLASQQVTRSPRSGHPSTGPAVNQSASQRGADVSCPPGHTSSEGGGAIGSVDDTLVLLPGPTAAMGPVPFRAVRQLPLFSQRGLQMMEAALRTWREAVGWTAPALVYQL